MTKVSSDTEKCLLIMQERSESEIHMIESLEVKRKNEYTKEDTLFETNFNIGKYASSMKQKILVWVFFYIIF